MRKWKLFFLLHQVAKAASGAGSTFSSGNELSLFHQVYSTKAVFCGGMKLGKKPSKMYMYEHTV